MIDKTRIKAFDEYEICVVCPVTLLFPNKNLSKSGSQDRKKTDMDKGFIIDNLMGLLCFQCAILHSLYIFIFKFIC